MFPTIEKQKAPKVLADSTIWVDNAVIEFGISGLLIRSLIEFYKSTLKHSNPTVRSSATKGLVTLRMFAGDGIDPFSRQLLILSPHRYQGPA